MVGSSAPESASLADRVVSAVGERVGQELRSASYRCLRYEASASAIGEPDFYMGGELLLEFEGGPLFVSWDENAGWRSHFSVRASTNPIFLPNADLESFDASLLAIWRPHIGSPLVASQVLGRDGTPYAVVLCFASGSILVGSSSRTELGDGDDVLVREASFLDRIPPLDTLWSSEHAA